MSVGRGSLLVVSETRSSEFVSYFQNGGYGVHETTVELCLTAIKQHNPDLILLALPRSEPFDASDLLSCLKKIDQFTPVVLLAARGSEQQVVPLLEQGATDYFIGPAGTSSLLCYVVDRAIKRGEDRQLQDEHERMLVELEQDQRAGLRVQSNLLPDTPVTLAGFHLAHRIFPSLILSGDSVNYFTLKDKRILFYLADVSGHGAAGAIVSVALSGLSRRLELDFANLGLKNSADILGWFNDELLTLKLEQHITMFIGILDCNLNRMEYSNAAHFPGAIVKEKDRAVFLELGGLPLGICKTEYDYTDIELPKVFNLVMFSDGVLEIMPQESIKEKEEYLRLLVECGNTEIDTLVEHLGLEDVVEVPDDIAVFTVAR